MNSVNKRISFFKTSSGKVLSSQGCNLKESFLYLINSGGVFNIKLCILKHEGVLYYVS